MGTNKFCEVRDVLGQKNRVMNEFFMTFIAKEYCLAFVPPRTRIEYSFSLRATAVSRAPKEALSYVVVFCGVAAPGNGRACVRVTSSVQVAATDCAVFDGRHFEVVNKLLSCLQYIYLKMTVDMLIY